MKTLSQRLAETHAQAVADTKGPSVVEPGGALAIPPTTGELMMWFKTYQQQAEATITALNTTITQLQAVLNGKASANSLSDVRQTVNSLNSTVEGKADTTYVDGQLQAASGLDAKQTADIQGLLKAINDEAPITQSILTRLNAQELATGTLQANAGNYALAATVSALTGQVTAVRNTVNDGNTGLAATKLIADTATAEVAKRLLKTGDTATGSIMVPNATANAAAPRFDQTFGGLNSPVRAAYNISTAAVALGPGPLTDPTPQGRKAQVIQVFIAMRTAPTLGVSTTIKIGTTPGGSEVYSKTYTLTALPVLNSLLQPPPTSIAELPAGTTLYAQVVNNLGTDGGKWDAIVQSYYKS